MRDADFLAEIGRRLHGEHWQGALSRALDINRQTILRWLTGHTPLPADHRIWDKLAAHARDRADDYGRVADDIERAAPSHRHD